MRTIEEERMAGPEELKLLEGFIGVTLRTLAEGRPTLESLTRSTALLKEDEAEIMGSGVADALRGYFTNRSIDPAVVAKTLATSGMGLAEIERFIKGMANRIAASGKTIERIETAKRAQKLIDALNDPSLFNVWISGGSLNPDERGYQPPMV